MPNFANPGGREPRSSVATLFPHICNSFTAAATAIVVVASCGSAHAQGAYDTSDPDYIARGEKMVSEGRIRKECLPVNAGKPDAKYLPIPEPSAELIAAAKKEGHFVLNSGISDQPSIEAYKAAFELRYPEIKLSVASGGTAALEERFLCPCRSCKEQRIRSAVGNRRHASRNQSRIQRSQWRGIAVSSHTQKCACRFGKARLDVARREAIHDGWRDACSRKLSR